MHFPDSVLFIFGDFNMPNINWEIQSVSGSYRDAHAFVRTCPDFRLSQAHFTQAIFLTMASLQRASITVFSKMKTTYRQIKCCDGANFVQMNRKLVFF